MRIDRPCAVTRLVHRHPPLDAYAADATHALSASTAIFRQGLEKFAYRTPVRLARTCAAAPPCAFLHTKASLMPEGPPHSTAPSKAVASDENATQTISRPTASTLDIRDVTKTFGAFTALDGISLSLRAGELVSILGPSGCGKSTLLRVIAGLDDADAGDILIGGQSVKAISPKDRGVAFVFQSYALYPHLNGYDNIAAPLVMRELSAFDRLPLVGKYLPAAGRKYASIAQRVNAVAALLKIEPFLARKPSQLSGGQRQRIALGRALIREPKLFLLDEPLANLDASLRNHTRAELSTLQKRLGTTTVFVTHDQTEAMALSDRIALMFAGQIRQIGTPDELYRNPVDLDVAKFLSQPYLNTLPAAVVASGRAIVAGEHLAIADARSPDSIGIVGVRPEHCSLLMRQAPGTLAVSVERLEHAGAEAHVFVRLRGTGDVCVVRVASGTMNDWPVGTSAWLAIHPAEGWFFPRAAHRRDDALPYSRAVA
jgi:multiple sugar transport system ATP-binding protein